MQKCNLKGGNETDLRDVRDPCCLLLHGGGHQVDGLCGTCFCIPDDFEIQSSIVLPSSCQMTTCTESTRYRTRLRRLRGVGRTDGSLCSRHQEVAHRLSVPEITHDVTRSTEFSPQLSHIHLLHSHDGAGGKHRHYQERNRSQS